MPNPQTDASSQFAVEVKNLVKQFGNFIAVDHVTFDVKKGEIFGFLGPNGAGKSTTIRMLCGILVPTSGWGRVNGLDIITQSEEIKKNIGYMSQKFSLYDDLTIEENLNFYSGIYRVPEALKGERKEWALEMAHLKDRKDNMTSELAGGWKQRLALGCAVLHQPSILFLDEPTAGVDPASRRRFWDLIYDLAEKEITVFVTTHYMDEVEHCGRLALIYRGKLIAVGSPEELKKKKMPDKVLEIDCSDPVSAVEVLHDNGIESAIFGNNIHVMTKGSGDESEKIKKIMGEKEILVSRVEMITPSMEDVFVSLIESENSNESD